MDTGQRESGFTLGELAVVVAIVGLLLGALIGAQRIEGAHAALTATIAHVAAYGAATAIFLDRYGGLARDVGDAANRIAG